MSAYELAQLNVALMREPLESPRMADFVANLDRINALAESSPGFVWRMQSEEGNATAFRPLGDDTLVNISVWRDVQSLNKYVYGSAESEVRRPRKEMVRAHAGSVVRPVVGPKGAPPEHRRGDREARASPGQRTDPGCVQLPPCFPGPRCSTTRRAIRVRR